MESVRYISMWHVLRIRGDRAESTHILEARPYAPILAERYIKLKTRMFRDAIYRGTISRIFH